LSRITNFLIADLGALNRLRQRAGPDMLASMMDYAADSEPLPRTFDELQFHTDVRQGIRDAGFSELTEIQRRCFPHSLAGRDVAAQSQTGTGKTAAFLLTIFNRLANVAPSASGTPLALILAPTRELAVQIDADAALLGRHTHLHRALVHGGVGYGTQRRDLGAGADLVTGTPGRIMDLMRAGTLKLNAVRLAVIDEADRMFDMGFIKDLNFILDQLPPVALRQTMLFSATLSVRVLELAQRFMNQPVMLAVNPEHITVDEVEEELYHVDHREKLGLLLGLLRREPWARVLIFSNTKIGARLLARDLAANNLPAKYISSEIPQAARERTLKLLSWVSCPSLSRRMLPRAGCTLTA